MFCCAGEHRQTAVRQLFIALALLIVSVSPAFAQLDRGTISGTIKDAQGGVMPGVTVTAVSTLNKQERSTVTDGSGFYTFANLQPGTYDITAELQGFKKASRQNVQLDAAGALAMDLALEAGAVTEVVTVTADTPLLQTDVAVRKTVEAKDIELLSFQGRNPIGVAGLKAGVSGGNFNTRGFGDLGNGGYNINGSRSDENNITIDGATAIRTRSSGNIIGIQNVDAIQEVQVLTANYMPEYGRSSGGQIRFVTKSGSNNYTGSASFFYRDDSLQANTWARNRSPNAVENSGPAPFDYKQYGYAFGGPVPGSMFKDKLFFFGAQEWVDFFQVQTNSVTVPTAAMRNGDFSELLNPNNGFFSGARVINNPATGQPFPDNIIPAGMLSPNGRAIMNTYPLPTDGYRQGTANLIQTSESPTDQRKDHIRLDYRMNDRNSFTYRYSGYKFVELAAFFGNFPFARRIFDRPNETQTASWTSSISNTWINELTYTYSKDNVFIDVYTESGLYQRSRSGINYPYVFPDGKEIEDKIPTVSIGSGGFSSFDGGPYPASSAGPIHTWSNISTLVRGRHTFKAGVQFEYSGEDDFDQINVNATPGGTNNQNGSFTFTDSRANGTGTAISNVAMGLFSNYAELGQRNFTQWRALATDVFVQDSWKPRTNMTIEGGVRWVYWPPWYSTTNNIASFDPAYYDQNNEAVMSPGTGLLLSGPRYNGLVLPGDGFKGDAADSPLASDPAVLALFRGAPRGFSETHANAFEPRLGMSYSLNQATILRASAGVFHNRVTLNDSTLLGGNPPFQPQATIENGSADNPAGTSVGGKNLPFAVTGQDPVFKHPTAYTWSVGMQREIPYGFTVDVTYVGRRGLYLQRERNINQLALGTIQANPGVNIAALRPYTGYGAIRQTENAGRSKYNSLQLSIDRRYRNGLKVGAAYTLGKSEDNGSDKRVVLWNTYDDTAYWGTSEWDRRHNLNFYYIYDLPFWRDQSNLIKSLLGGWQISGATFMRSGTPANGRLGGVVQTSNDIAGVGDVAVGQPWDMVGDIDFKYQLYTGAGTEAFNTAAFRAPAAGTFGNAPRNVIINPGEMQWDLALFKNFSVGGARKLQLRAEAFNFLNHPNLGGIEANPTNGNFGRITSKSGSRDIQLSVRFAF
jgi:Carboxypeptidase regulatory-like domain